MGKKPKLPSGYFVGQYGRVKGHLDAKSLFSIMLISKDGSFTKLHKPVYVNKNNQLYIKYGGKHLKVHNPKKKGFRWDTPFDYVAYKK
jgi:hypothetical protein